MGEVTLSASGEGSGVLTWHGGQYYNPANGPRTKAGGTWAGEILLHLCLFCPAPRAKEGRLVCSPYGFLASARP